MDRYRGLKEPLFHGTISYLPENHYLAHVSTYCRICNGMVHTLSNENMQPWMETGRGNYCLPCFIDDSVLNRKECFSLKRDD